MAETVIAGRNAVMEALKSGREINKLMILKSAEGSAKKIASIARDKKIIVQYVDKKALDRVAEGTCHQGVLALVSDFIYCELEDILEFADSRGEQPFIVVLDGIEDPHNLGAIMRSADGAGIHGIIIPKRRAATVTAVVEKAAAGAAEYMRVARVGNISTALEELKKKGLWIGALDMEGEVFYEANLMGSLALVVGNEGKGISRLVKEHCDFSVSIPMMGGVDSLNASNAAAILMYEVVKQRNKYADILVK